MRRASVLGYTTARCVLSWAPVWVVFFLIISIGYPSGNPAPSSLKFGAAILVPISAWMAVATFRGEDPVQAAAHGLHYGNPTGYRLLVSVSSFLASIAVLPVSLLWALARAPRIAHTSPEFLIMVKLVIMALVAGVAGAAVGTAIGTWLTRPIVERGSTGFIVGGVLGIGLIAIPRIPPVRLLTDVIITTPSVARAGETVLVTLASLVVAGAASWLAAVTVRRRT